MADSVSLTLGNGFTGTPLTSQFTSDLAAALAGGTATATFFSNQEVFNNFFAWLAQDGESCWIQTTDQSGNTIFYATQTSPSHSVSLVLRALPDTDVINGQKPPVSIVIDGKANAVAGSVIATVESDGIEQWKLSIPIGLASHLSFDLLEHMAWESVCLPMLRGLSSAWSGLWSDEASQAARMNPDELAAYMDGLNDAERAAAEAAVSEVPLTVGTAILGAGAMIGMAGLVLLPAVIDVISHTTSHNVRVFNTTPFDLTWSISYQGHGSLIASPVNADGSTNYALPAVSSSAPGDPSNVPLASAANLIFTSNSQLSGIAYVLTFTVSDPATGDTIDSASVMFDMPYDGENSTSVTTGELNDAEGWCSSQEGTNPVTQVQATGKGYTLSATFDYLSGTHAGPSGLVSYVYNSLVAFQPANQV